MTPLNRLFSFYNPNYIAHLGYFNGTVVTESLIRLLNPKLRGWANYYRHVVFQRIFCWVDTAIFQAIYRWWIRRRHPNKGAGWIFETYFKHPAPNNWWFHAKTRTVAGHADLFRLIRVASTRIVRHIKVIAEATPYDPAYTSYFERRTGQRRSSRREVWQPV